MSRKNRSNNSLVDRFTKNILLLFWFEILIFISLALGNTAVWSQDDPHLFFLGIPGETSNGKAPVLLRWYAIDGSIPVDSFSVYRKEGDADSIQSLTLLSVTSRIRNEPLIRSIFEQPSQQKALFHIQEVLGNMLEIPVTNDTLASQLISVLDSTCDECAFRRSMLINSNYAVAIVEGLGYLDLVPPGTYTYELRTSKTADGTDDLVIGRITVDATQPTKLPAPLKPEEVDVPGDRGDRRIYLNWEISPELKNQRSAFFAYNVYRGNGDASGDDFYGLLETGQLKKINLLPILPPSAQALGSKPEDRYVFVDDNYTYKKSGREGVPFTPGETYTYWVLPIDLMGQEGEPSQPVVGIVPDKSAPQVPGGLATQATDLEGVKRIVLTWNRNTDDAIGYKVYRFREWDHVGKKDSFPPVNGFVEGYQADVLQPSSEAPFFNDPAIDGSMNENQSFWYCVSAFDEWGNESPLSAPHRGILFDTTPPNPPATVQDCAVFYYCDLSLVDFIPYTDSTSADNNRVAIDLTINHPDSLENSMRVQVKRIAICADPELIPPADKMIFDGVFDATGVILVHDDFPRPDHGVEITYWIITYLDGHQVCQEFPIPDNQYRTIFDEYILNGTSLSIAVDVHEQEAYECEPVVSGERPHSPYDDYGNIRPILFDVNQSEDAVGVILYRSTDCVNYYQVDEFRFGSALSLKTKDYYAPEQGGRICYGLRYFDENHNLSPIYYIPVQFKFPSAKTTQVVPSMTAAEPLGDLTSPGLYLAWFGSNVGLAGFRVEIADARDFSGTLRSVHLGQSDYSFVEKNNEFQTALDEIDDKTKEKIQIDKTYFIRVFALLQNGEERASNNSLQFIWSADQTPHEHPNWPVRPLPPVTPELKAAWLPKDDEQNRFGYGVELYIGDFNPNMEGSDNGFVFFVKTPFIVYRKRVDIPNRSYLQISPLIDRIVIENNELVADPFINYVYDILVPNEYVVAYLDSVDLIEGARYEYKIVQLNKKTGEIERVFGPSNPVEVNNQ